ncbi:MAG: hypothetical protein RKO66_09515 [Candidatus Contendobacter sp.]|nr:hypothetical protein [Candidatus Contendobacter sp.]MDS4059532.1 hypothetical protein [Candidatus Contendobacter sp.]
MAFSQGTAKTTMVDWPAASATLITLAFGPISCTSVRAFTPSDRGPRRPRRFPLSPSARRAYRQRHQPQARWDMANLASESWEPAGNACHTT